jgi:uncharacterized protein (TIGR02145 family)
MKLNFYHIVPMLVILAMMNSCDLPDLAKRRKKEVRMDTLYGADSSISRFMGDTDYSDLPDLPSSPEVRIGKQVWTTQNLNVTTFRNGDTIPEARSEDQWVEANEKGKPVWCHYENNPENGKKYGRLYNWYAVIDPRGLAPTGWHIPSDDEWTTLTMELGGTNAGAKLKARKGWPGEFNGTNAAGFYAIPHGYRFTYGEFYNLGFYAPWWSTTQNGSGDVWLRHVNYYTSSVHRISDIKERGVAVRCIKD